MHDWKPGPRKGFGERALLTKSFADLDNGSVILGEGSNSVILPCRGVEEFPSKVILTQNNKISTLNDLKEGIDFTVLLGCENGRPYAHGLEGWKVWPDQSYNWDRDQFDRELVLKSDNGKFWFNTNVLSYVLKPLGGTMAFTVVSADHAGRNLYVNRSWQQPASDVPPGMIVKGKIIAAVADNTRILVSFGSGLALLPAFEFIQGIPPQYVFQVIELLKEKISIFG